MMIRNAITALVIWVHHHYHRLPRIRPLGLFRFRIFYFLKLMNLLDSW